MLSSQKDSETTPVASVMTFNPVAVSPSDYAHDAINKMIAGRFRHMPVCDDKTGFDASRSWSSSDVNETFSDSSDFQILDITKCVKHSIDRIEMACNAKYGLKALNRKTSSIFEPFSFFASPASNSTLPTLQTLISDGDEADLMMCDILPATSSVLHACIRMQKSRQTAVLVFKPRNDTELYDEYDPEFCDLVGMCLLIC